MKNEELKRLLTNPEVFPVELTLTSGDKVKIEHPDFVHVSQKLDQVFIWSEETYPLFDSIAPTHIAKIRARRKRDAA